MGFAFLFWVGLGGFVLFLVVFGGFCVLRSWSKSVGLSYGLGFNPGEIDVVKRFEYL